MRSKALKIAMAAAALGASSTALANENGFGKIYTAGHWVSASPVRSSFRSWLTYFSGPVDLRADAQAFVAANASLLGLDRSSQLTESSVLRGPALETHRFRKLWHGLEVVGGETLVQFRSGRVAFASGDSTPLLALDPAPRVPAADALRIAFSSYPGHAHRAEPSELKVLLRGGAARLAYAVKVVGSDLLASEVHYVDAGTAEELLVTSNVQPIAGRSVLAGSGSPADFDVVSDADETRVGRDFPTLLSGGGCAPACRETTPEILASASAAFANSGLVLDYYLAAHGRDSVDGAGLPIRSVVNFGGAAFQNAAWYNDRHIMLYGLGAPGGKYNDFASPLDVVAHEITHGLTASTAALQYAGESGALNESYSDVFGKLVAFRNGKPGDWKIGRELFRDGTTFIRDLENPAIGSYKDLEYRGEVCNRPNDYCGVHENSGIPSKAAVAIAKRLGLDHFAQLYYLTLTQLLRPASDFREARAQTEAACATLFGEGSADCRAVSEAFAGVGI